MSNSKSLEEQLTAAYTRWKHHCTLADACIKEIEEDEALYPQNLHIFISFMTHDDLVRLSQADAKVHEQVKLDFIKELGKRRNHPKLKGMDTKLMVIEEAARLDENDL